MRHLDAILHSIHTTRLAVLSPGVSVSRTAAPSALNSYHAAGCSEGRCASPNKSYFFTHSTFSKYCGMNYVTLKQCSLLFLWPEEASLLSIMALSWIGPWENHVFQCNAVNSSTAYFYMTWWKWSLCSSLQ